MKTAKKWIQEQYPEMIHDDEFMCKMMEAYAAQQVAEVTRQRDELLKDIDFLAHRQQKAGSVSFTEERETGISSNSIVAIAYGIVKPENQSLPCDWSDLNACRNMWKKLPDHRKTGVVLNAMQRAKFAIKSTER